MCEYSEDIAFPYMLDDRHDDDTAFVVFESDFRFYERDDVPAARWLPDCLLRSPDPVQMPPGSARYPEHRPDTDSIGKFGGLIQPVKNIDLAGTVRNEIHELISALNIASRHECGSVMWAGYNVDGNPQSGKVNIIGFCSQCMVYTTQGARDVLDSMQKEKPYHFDLFMKHTLKESRQAGADRPAGLANHSFIFPPIGGFAAHESFNTEGAVRPSFWHAVWSSPGSVGAGSEPRKLVRWSGEAKGRTSVVCSLPLRGMFDAKTCWWFTELPPCQSNRTEFFFFQILRHLKYLDEDGIYRGPPWSPGEGWKVNKKTNKWVYVEHEHLRKLREEPDACDDHADPALYPSHLALKTALCNRDVASSSQRARRRGSLQRSLYKFRRFVPYQARFRCAVLSMHSVPWLTEVA